jgi:hypothetical protein
VVAGTGRRAGPGPRTRAAPTGRCDSNPRRCRPARAPRPPCAVRLHWQTGTIRRAQRSDVVPGVETGQVKDAVSASSSAADIARLGGKSCSGCTRLVTRAGARLVARASDSGSRIESPPLVKSIRTAAAASVPIVRNVARNSRSAAAASSRARRSARDPVRWIRRRRGAAWESRLFWRADAGRRSPSRRRAARRATVASRSGRGAETRRMRAIAAATRPCFRAH